MPDQQGLPRGSSTKIATGLAPAATASRADKAIYVTTRYAAQNDHFIGLYKKWTKTINFLNGDHWRSQWDATSLDWVPESNLPPWVQRPVTNMVYRVYRSALAKLTKQKPELEVVPASGSSQDREAAQLSDALLVYLWRALRKPQKLPIVLGWMLATGIGWIRVAWDPTAGEPRPRTIPMQRPVPSILGAMGGGQDQDQDDDADMETVDVAADENGDAYKDETGIVDWDREPDLVPPGEICFEPESTLSVRVNPEATSLENITEMYVAKLWSKVALADHHGVTVEQLGGGGESDETRAMYEDSMSSSSASFPQRWDDPRAEYGYWGASQQMAIGDRVLEIQWYAKPSAKYPKGRHLIVAGGTVVWPPEAKLPDGTQIAEAAKLAKQAGEFANGEAELPEGFWPPLVPMADTPIPGQPLSLSLVGQMVSINEAANVLDGKIAEHQVSQSMGGAWIASELDRGHFEPTSEPAQVLFSKAMTQKGAAYAPFQAVMHPLPESVYLERNVFKDKVTLVTGLGSIDHSQKATGESGRALLVQEETSDSEFMPTLFSMESALEECGRRELILAQRHYREERMISIRTQDGKYLFRSFTNADLRAGHDVRVSVGSAFPWNKAAQLDTRFSFIQAFPGLVTNAQTGEVDGKKLAGYMGDGLPGFGAFEPEADADLVQTNREHSMFEMYDPMSPDGSHDLPQISFMDNAMVHYQQHTDFWKKDWERFRRWAPQAQQAFLQHIQQTLQQLQTAANTLAAAQQAPPGPGAAGGAPGGGGPPGGGGGPPGGGPPQLSLIQGGPGGGGSPSGGVPASQMSLTPQDMASAQ